jgi:hypothetical protein
MKAILVALVLQTVCNYHVVLAEETQSAKLRTSMKKRPESPAWVQELPPKGSREFSGELRKKVLEGPSVDAAAVIVEFQPAAIAQQGDVGVGGATISGSKVRVVSPSRFKGLEFFVHHRATPAEDSCWRVAACKVAFDIKERMLEIRQNKELADYALFVYDTDLKSIRFGTGGGPRARDGQKGTDGR